MTARDGGVEAENVARVRESSQSAEGASTANGARVLDVAARSSASTRAHDRERRSRDGSRRSARAQGSTRAKIRVRDGRHVRSKRRGDARDARARRGARRTTRRGRAQRANWGD